MFSYGVRAFTLIELMIVVAVLGILSALAYPSYRDYIQRGERMEAVTAMNEMAQQVEKSRLMNGSYPDPASFPVVKKTGVYDIEYTTEASAGSVVGYTVAASFSKQAACSPLTINQASIRTAKGSIDPKVLKNCFGY
jgi:type IV pilus assembly protein PilE